ncbi:hypothetical protein [Oleiharenicola lentus]|uniref:hypothetical protein n=1 Tax=Oleiharenicola lentus TaxID=2508720 RepID=UPI003F67440E
MKNPRAFPHEQLKFAIALIVLAGLAALAWWTDPNRARNGASRIPWPAAPVAKP